MTERRFEYDVFLSYSSADKLRVHRLAQRLRDSGLRVWLDDWFIKAGMKFPDAIDQAFASSRRVIACWSPSYWASDWGRAESAGALGGDPKADDIRYIPVLLVDCQPPEPYRRIKYLDYRDESKPAFLELLAACSQHPAEAGLVQPLHVTEDRFLQVLLSQFSLRRNAQGGAELRLYFDDDSPAIWSSQAKTSLRGKMAESERERYQKKFDDFLLRGQRDTCYFNDANFWFRYASGGTLPVITLTDVKGGANEYYCLFYRDVNPIGWNIANGGCDNRAELLNPQLTIARELREELLIADFEQDTRYVFGTDGEPAHRVARRLWSRAHRDLDLMPLRTREVQIEWDHGPDSLHIQVGRDETVIPEERFYLNINGDDFGIEVDRIARIQLPRTVTLFDGELEGAVLVNSPVGLFATASFDRRLCKGETRFRPDLFFFDAQRYDAADGRTIDDVLRQFQEHVRHFRTPKESAELQASIEAGTQYSLCPVTARIVERHLRATGRWAA